MRGWLVMDLDGTICGNKGDEQNYADLLPVESVVDRMRKAHEDGVEIVICTARGMRTYNGDKELIDELVKPVVEAWLRKHSIPYDRLVMGKEWAGRRGFYVDDRAMTPQEFVGWVPSTLIVPLGGRSSRFPALKYIMGVGDTIMLKRAVDSVNPRLYDRMVFVVVRAHEEEYGVVSRIMHLFPDAEVLVLDDFTSSQSETVATAIESLNIEGQITVRDCDNEILIPQIPAGNSVCGYEIRYGEDIQAHANKSFIEHTHDTVTGIVEKEIRGNTVSCGAYTFSDAREFVRYYKGCSVEGECYISSVISAMIADGISFGYMQTSIFHDWGTWESFERYKREYDERIHIPDSILR